MKGQVYNWTLKLVLDIWQIRQKKKKTHPNTLCKRFLFFILESTPIYLLITFLEQNILNILTRSILKDPHLKI